MPAPGYTFGPFTLDPADRRLLRAGKPVEVTARYFDALLLLVGEKGRLVSKERFHDEVWNGIPVTDEALTQCVRTLRRALGDDAGKPLYIETVPRHGYRFVAPVETGSVPGRAEERPLSVLPDIAAAALGGGTAGIVGALGYITIGFVGPGIGAASTLLVLISVNLLLGLLAAGAIGAGIAALSRRGAWSIAGGAGGGLLVGAVGHMVGNDLFVLFFGHAPGAFSGAAEGLLLGAATGFGVWCAARSPAKPLPFRLAPAVLAGSCAGLVLASTGGRLMVGSLAALAERFPESRLQLEALGGGMLGAATVVEATVFCAAVAAAMIIERRMRS